MCWVYFSWPTSRLKLSAGWQNLRFVRAFPTLLAIGFFPEYNLLSGVLLFIYWKGVLSFPVCWPYSLLVTNLCMCDFRACCILVASQGTYVCKTIWGFLLFCMLWRVFMLPSIFVDRFCWSLVFLFFGFLLWEIWSGHLIAIISR